MALCAQTNAKILSPHRPVRLPPFCTPILRRKTNLRCFCLSEVRRNYDHIPKQFREENLTDGLMDNYKKVPEFLYGLPREQLNMFTSNMLARQSSKIPPESLGSAGFYKKFSNMNKKDDSFNFDSRINMNYRGIGLPEDPPPDLPSYLLDSRIIVLGMPMYEAVTKLIVNQIYFLNYNDSTKPMFLYIHSTGTQDEKREVVGSETEAYCIADMMGLVEAKVHTINIGIAHGQAAMLLSRGHKGKRFVMPHCSTSLYLPKIYKSSGPTSDMWRKAKDLEANADVFLESLSESTEKSKDEILKDIKYSKHFTPQEAIEYGLADSIVYALNDDHHDNTNARARKARDEMREAARLAKGSSGTAVRPAGR